MGFLFISILGIFCYRKTRSITIILFLFLLISAVGAFLVGRQHDNEFDTIVCVGYISFILWIIFDSFKNYTSISYINNSNIQQTKFHRLEILLIIIASLFLIIDLYILYRVFNLLLIGLITVQEHKNESGASEVFNSIVSPIIITLSNFVNPLGYSFISLHFYYLSLNNARKAIVCFVLSLLICISGFLALSRSATTSYLMVYFLLFIIFYPSFSKKIRKRLILPIVVIIGSIALGLSEISESRFSDYYTKESKNHALIDETNNPLLFSIIDYYSQWEDYGIKAVKYYSPEWLNYGLYNSCGLANYIVRKMLSTNDWNNLTEKRYDKMLRGTKSHFHGVVGRLIYDFGFVGTLFFVLLYRMYVKRMSPHNGIISFKSLLFLPTLLPFCVNFFSGNLFSSISIDLAIIYNIIIIKYISK